MPDQETSAGAYGVVSDETLTATDGAAEAATAADSAHSARIFRARVWLPIRSEKDVRAASPRKVPSDGYTVSIAVPERRVAEDGSMHTTFSCETAPT